MALTASALLFIDFSGLSAVTLATLCGAAGYSRLYFDLETYGCNTA
jgi:hypothetical protein